MRECPTVRVTVPNPPPVVSVPVPVPPVIKLAGGVRGPAGEGVPAGGTTGQVLSKASDTDYDTEYRDIEEVPTPVPQEDLFLQGGAHFVTATHTGETQWRPLAAIPAPGYSTPVSGTVQVPTRVGYNFSWQTIAQIPAPPAPQTPDILTAVTAGGQGPRWVKALPLPQGQPADQVPVTDGNNGATYQPHRLVPPATATSVPQALTIPATTPVEDARNLYPNPTAAPGGAGWEGGGTGGTITMTGNGYELTRGSSGTFYASSTGLTAGTVGAYYSMRAKVSALTANMVGKPIYIALNNGSTFLAGSPDASAGVYPPLGQSVTITLPATLAADTTGLVRPILYTRDGAVSGDKVLLNEIDIRRVNGAGQSVTGDFFTGDTPNTDTHQYAWAGTPHNSASIRYSIDTSVQWAPTLPPPPPTGTHTLTSVDGVITWAAN